MISFANSREAAYKRWPLPKVVFTMTPHEHTPEELEAYEQKIDHSMHKHAQMQLRQAQEDTGWKIFNRWFVILAGMEKECVLRAIEMKEAENGELQHIDYA